LIARKIWIVASRGLLCPTQFHNAPASTGPGIGPQVFPALADDFGCG